MQMIRAILSYINKKAQMSGNMLAQCITCCCMCCMWCLENCLRFINKNAYVQVSCFTLQFGCKSLTRTRLRNYSQMDR